MVHTDQASVLHQMLCRNPSLGLQDLRLDIFYPTVIKWVRHALSILLCSEGIPFEPR